MEEARKAWLSLTPEQRAALWHLVDVYHCDEVRGWTPGDVPAKRAN